MGYNVNKYSNDERLSCVAFIKKGKRDIEELEYNANASLKFHAKLLSHIEKNFDINGKGFKTSNTTLAIETSDIVDEVEIDDHIRILNYNQDFIVENKFIYPSQRGSEYMTFKKINKKVVFYLRGDL